MSTTALVSTPIVCKLCGKAIPEGVPIVGEPPDNVRRRKVAQMNIHMQDRHPVQFQTAVTAGIVFGQTVPAILIAADFDLPDDMAKQRQIERARLAKTLRRTTLTDEQLRQLLNSGWPEADEDDQSWVMVLLRNLRDRYEEIGEYAP